MLIFNTILNLVFPRFCLGCGQKGEDLCLKCLTNSPEAGRECARWIFPLYDYRHPPIRCAIRSLKYKNRRGLARIFAEVLYNRILEELADLAQLENFRDAILIPIPLSSRRLRERGFNQASLICEALAKMDREENFILEKRILIKPKNTEQQARIESRSQRLKNIIGSFGIKNPEKIKNRNIILVDDVITTGATLQEARKVLKESGARKIIAFTLAH
jgi:ComF family protein